MLVIESKQNAQVKHWKKLLTAKGRKKSGFYLVEGLHLVEEVLKSDQIVTHLLIHLQQHSADRFATVDKKVECIAISQSVVLELTQTEAPQGIFAVVKLATGSNWTPSKKNVLFVDGVQDPGNLGTIIRTADAAGFGAVFLGEGTVDPYNDKVLRASQGSIWHLPVIQTNLQEMAEKVKVDGYRLLVTALHQKALAYHQVDVNQKVALVVGNEGQGVSSIMLNMADELVFIPMPGQAESLNVAVASGILMFHFQ